MFVFGSKDVDLEMPEFVLDGKSPASCRNRYSAADAVVPLPIPGDGAGLFIFVTVIVEAKSLLHIHSSTGVVELWPNVKVKGSHPLISPQPLQLR